MHAWHSTLHVLDDGSGIGAGYGGGINWNGHRDWTKEEYGPNSRCIETTKPFQVAVSFPVDSTGRLVAMVTELSQPGRPCNLTIKAGASGYWHNGRDGMAELTEALKAGMTPIVSYWSSENMLWMDGRGADGLGPCDRDEPEACANRVKFFDFSLEPITAGLQQTTGQSGLLAEAGTQNTTGAQQPKQFAASTGTGNRRLQQTFV